MSWTVYDFRIIKELRSGNLNKRDSSCNKGSEDFQNEGVK